MTDIVNLRKIYSVMDRYDVSMEFYTALNFATDLLGALGNLSLEDMVRNSPDTMDFLRNGQKIQAIKELRSIAKCSLLDAKNAVEAVESQDAIDRLREKLAQ